MSSQAPSNAHKRTRSRSPSRSPPRQRKRPGTSARVSAAAKALAQERQAAREIALAADAARAAAQRGSSDVVKQHYNAVPQRGREWRRTDSKIKNLRAYNNWAKSVIIHKFSPSEEFHSNDFSKNVGGLAVLDIGCGKGGDLGKWAKAPQRVAVYVGVDPAEISVEQARERYGEMRGRARGRIFDASFWAKDGFGEWVGEIPVVKEVGVMDASGMRYGGAGFDVVAMMFCMHYSFESEAKARGMLRNVASTLKKGGRFLGVIPDSDVIRNRVKEWFQNNKKSAGEHSKQDGEDSTGEAASQAVDGEAQHDQDGASDQARTEPASTDANPVPADPVTDRVPVTTDPDPVPAPAPDPPANDPSPEAPNWGNSVYSLAFPPTQAPPASGIFRPQYGWRYQFFLTEAVESVPEYVVPFEAFRGLAEEYNLELQYHRNFHEIYREEYGGELGRLADRMGVPRGMDGLEMGEEWEAIGLYAAFCLYKV